ncbi:MAG: DegV family protein [Chloroflexi bacterium]|nr:DegV family protein [Chloroflexota bacterium]
MIRVVTDSTSDIPKEIAQGLGITVVPCNVHFGEEVYRDGADLTADDFYQRLTQSTVFPTTSQPSAGVFLEAYRQLAQETDQIVSIHISAKLSGTINSAMTAVQSLGGRCRIEIVDSAQTTMALGLIAIAAAEAAKGGQTLEGVLKTTREAISTTRVFALLDTLEYLKRGGRIGKLQAFLGSLLNIKPILTVKDGEAHPMERVRTKAKGMDRLFALAKGCMPANDIAVVYSTNQGDAEAFTRRLGAIYPAARIRRARIGPVLGAHLGPGAIGVVVRGGS